MTVPWLAEAVVTAQDSDNYAVFVSLSSGFGGQIPTLSVRVGTQGPRDTVRGHFPELPLPGTAGIVAFTRGDLRNGIWLCSVSTQLTDAIAQSPGSGSIAYAAHYGGGWSQRSIDGSITETLPDGTILQIGPTLPAPTRHVLGANQERVRSPFPAAQRVPQPPGAFPLSISHPTGASAVLTASGGWLVHAASGQAVSLTANGATVSLDASGNVTITAVASLTVLAADALFSGNITASGHITGASGVILDAHLHSAAGGSGDSGPPVPGT